MPAQRRVGVVVVRRACVQDRAVRQQLDVARAEVHVEVERGILREGVDEIEQLDLFGGEPWHVGMVLGFVDVPAEVEELEARREPREDRHREPRLLARPFLTVSIEVPRLAEQRDEIGPRAQQLSVDRDRADDLRKAAGLRGLKAQKPDDVGAVDMERLTESSAVAAYGRIVGVRSVIADVAQEIAVRVLRDGHPEMHPERHVRERGIVLAELVDGKSAHEHEAAPRVEGVCPTIDDRSEPGEGDVVSAHGGQVEAEPVHGGDGFAKIGDLALGQLVNPVRLARELDPAPSGRVDRSSRRHEQQVCSAAGSPPCASVTQHAASASMTGASASTV